MGKTAYSRGYLAGFDHAKRTYKKELAPSFWSGKPSDDFPLPRRPSYVTYGPERKLHRVFKYNQGQDRYVRVGNAMSATSLDAVRSVAQHPGQYLVTTDEFVYRYEVRSDPSKLTIHPLSY